MADKQEAFRRLANSRVNKALNDIRLIGNLSNRANYEFSTEDIDAIISALRVGLADCKKRFDLAVADNERSFKL